MQNEEELKDREKPTGTYVYDKEQNKVIKISDRIPGVSAKKEGSAGPELPCGQSECSGGPCPMRGEG